MISLKHGLNDAEKIWQEGRATDQEIDDYIKAWNEGPHFYKAVRRVNFIQLVEKD
jgi:hypothetical protein